MNLRDLQPNQAAKVLEISSSLSTEVREDLFRHGLYPGATFQVLYKHPGFSQVRLRNTTLAIKKDSADSIQVTAISKKIE